MPKGLSLHIGVNRRNFDVEANYLTSPENNAKAMAGIANAESYSTYELLLSENATKENLVNKLNEVTKQLEPGDTLFLSFSGHGGQQEDKPEDGNDEDDDRDEYWSLYDGRFIDDEIRDHLRKIKKDVSVIVVSASCNSGSIIEFHRKEKKHSPEKKEMLTRSAKFTILTDPLVKASVLLISSCEDGQFTADGDIYSPFTKLLLKHWDSGKFESSYADFVFKILYDTIDYTQRPHLTIMGDNCESFLTKKPFKL